MYCVLCVNYSFTPVSDINKFTHLAENLYLVLNISNNLIQLNLLLIKLFSALICILPRWDWAPTWFYIEIFLYGGLTAFLKDTSVKRRWTLLGKKVCVCVYAWGEKYVHFFPLGNRISSEMGNFQKLQLTYVISHPQSTQCSKLIRETWKGNKPHQLQNVHSSMF